MVESGLFDLDVAIIGAGAAGIGVGVVLNELELESYAILERDDIGASFRQWPDEMQFITPSFPGNNFGCRDLNSVTRDTSPAFALDCEHPSGEEYAQYLEAIAEYYELPVRTNMEVEAIDSLEDGFRLQTTDGTIRSRFVIWAIGQFGTPNDTPFPGAHHCVHNTQIGSWAHYVDEYESDPTLIVGGHESGIDGAITLSQLGQDVVVLDDDGSWKYRGPDPSEVLSPYTKQRLDTAIDVTATIDLQDETRVIQVDRADGQFDVVCTDGGTFSTPNPPILATGFDTTLGAADDYFATDDGHPVLTDTDESTLENGLFLVGPQVAHNGQKFCFIYKFRQRFAVVADTIATRLDIDRSPLDAYRADGMFLEDLSCCDPELCDC